MGDKRLIYIGVHFCLLAGLTALQGEDSTWVSDQPRVRRVSDQAVAGAWYDPNQSQYELTSALLFQPQPEVEPSIELSPTTDLPTTTTELSAAFLAGPGQVLASLNTQRQAIARVPSSSAVLGLESNVLVTTDTGNLLSRSNSILGVQSEHRTPVVTFNSARGQHVGQQLGSGSYWFPARQDLDTLLSKLDSRTIQDVIVIKGPYSSLYGPAFSFYDVELLDAPRFPNGGEMHYNTAMDWKQNGDQWYGRQTVWGGGPNYGFRIGYGERAGSDYETGQSSFEMPTSYHSRDWDAALGWNFGSGQRIDFHYLRLDQTDVEFPGQIYDLRYLVTDAYELEYVNECPGWSDLVAVEGWYNRTRFEGDNLGAGKRRQIPGLSNISVPLGPFVGVGDFTGMTDVDATSTGYTAAATWGCLDCNYVTLGSDLRFLKQNLNEINGISNIVGLPPFFPTEISFPNNPIPKARSANPGLFAEQGVAAAPDLNIRMGARVDFVSADANPTRSGLIETSVGSDLSRDFFLFSGYLSAERQIDQHWAFNAGAGYAERPPTMTELYADNPFIAVLPQLAVTRVIGNPNLRESGMWQVDAGLTADYPNLRGGVHAFYSWVNDYITYDFLDDIGLGSFNPVNTDLATLVGGELYGEYDINCSWTAFATMSYVQAKDRTRADSIGSVRRSLAPATTRSGSLATEEALAVIAPLRSRAGVRWHEACEVPGWALEFVAEMVDDQDRFASTLTERATPGFTLFHIRGYKRVTDGLLATIGVDNIGNRFYQEHFDPRFRPGTNLGVFQPGITFYTGFDWTY